ncbi:aldehyde dehydrogenase family protein [Aliiglaciecola sp. 3_MG-2023]|uniref:aldehyde dehydrogenase family protein n=1 Tax=Aliiglaciecola sp. 3_MG-2023 TaxID=3062644 RepID=UPI0026E44F3C|nr:aldehyde dehydrogenase family protein [Aliiglaciecola sp. 3_MG-2023]MDO6694509.1 aldehyde dehydrogenase family protein [Aliiglaciecola sp. 3_MG-2023]
MKNYQQLYIDGRWVNSAGNGHLDVVNPANGEICARVPSANLQDVELAVGAAKKAFAAWSENPSSTRAAIINEIADGMQSRKDDLTQAIVASMGCPISVAADLQVQGAIDALRSFAPMAAEMDKQQEHTNHIVVSEAVGVCVLINPWNYPLSQLVGKLGPALAAGCSIVVKPAEQTPLQDLILAEIIDGTSLPAGVFNLLTGVGSEIGESLCSHALVDMVSFTGSTLAGIKVAQAAAPTVKRVCQELGGKSPYIITPDADLDAAVRYGVEDVMLNSGQTCCALTRMLVPAEKLAEVESIAKTVAAEWQIGDPMLAETNLGPLSSQLQQQRVLSYINTGIAEGAKLLCGGTQVPEEFSKGAYVAPTIFSNVSNDMTIAQEEIFGPVLCIIPYQDIAHAIELANDTPFGLSSAVYAENRAEAIKVASKLRAGQCYLQGAYFNTDSPFGGYKQSGNGREWGLEGLKEYTETKALLIDADAS